MSNLIQPANGRELLTPKEVSDRLGVPLKTLSTRRYRGQLPRFVKVGALVRYPVRDLEEWLASNSPDAPKP